MPMSPKVWGLMGNDDNVSDACRDSGRASGTHVVLSSLIWLDRLHEFFARVAKEAGRSALGVRRARHGENSTDVTGELS
jgi:hypothetical protein